MKTESFTVRDNEKNRCIFYLNEMKKQMLILSWVIKNTQYIRDL